MSPGGLYSCVLSVCLSLTVSQPRYGRTVTGRASEFLHKEGSALQSDKHFQESLADGNSTPTDKGLTMVLGDWIAQFDQTYSTWFFYNVKTETSTWVKPKELEHVVFYQQPEVGAGVHSLDPRNFTTNSAYKSKNPPKRQVIYPGPLEQQQQQTLVNLVQQKQKVYPGQQQQQVYPRRRVIFPPQRAKDKLFVESTPGDFFGFNTTSYSQEGVIAGFRSTLSSLYENIVKDYVENVYTDVIEGYTIATIKLFGWFFVGSFLILKGAVLNGIKDGRSSARVVDGSTGRLKRDNVSDTFTLPFLEDLQLAFPADPSLLTCYQERQTCLTNDFPSELNLLLTNLRVTKEFLWRWLELAEKIGHMAMEGEAEL